MDWLEFSSAIIVSAFASNGLWSVVQAKIQKRNKGKSALEKGVIAMLHDKLYEKAEQYIARNGITVKELDNLRYIYEPYAEMGGNGTGKTLYEYCLKLPIIGEEGSHEEAPKA